MFGDNATSRAGLGITYTGQTSNVTIDAENVSDEDQVKPNLNDRLLKLKDKVEEVKKGYQDKIIDALDILIFVCNLA